MANILNNYDNVGKAHQRIIREQKAETDKNNLFGDWWTNIDLDLKKAVVKEIDFVTAKKMIEEYEWLGCMPAFVWYCYGIYFDGNCGGVCVFSPDYAENTGVWDKYDYTGKLVLLSRGVCVHWTPKNTGSKMIMEAIKMLPDKYKIVTCTIDRLAGEIGTIYQSCNFNYVGVMREGKTRTAYKIDGKIYGTRALRAKIGTEKKEDVLKHFPNAEYCEQLSKERYFYFRGKKHEQKYYKSKIEHLIKPYPKRKSNGFEKAEAGGANF